MRNIPIFYATQAYALVKMGYQIVDMEPNKHHKGLYVYFFEENEELKELLKEKFNYDVR